MTFPGRGVYEPVPEGRVKRRRSIHLVYRAVELRVMRKQWTALYSQVLKSPIPSPLEAFATLLHALCSIATSPVPPRYEWPENVNACLRTVAQTTAL